MEDDKRCKYLFQNDKQLSLLIFMTNINIRREKTIYLMCLCNILGSLTMKLSLLFLVLILVTIQLSFGFKLSPPDAITASRQQFTHLSTEGVGVPAERGGDIWEEVKGKEISDHELLRKICTWGCMMNFENNYIYNSEKCTGKCS